MGALFSVAALGVALLPAAAQGQTGTTYEIEVGADFFEQGAPGFSARFYPGSVSLHSGDTLHFFGFGSPVMFPEGMEPMEAAERWQLDVGDRYFPLAPDTDEGERAYKFDESAFAPTPAGTGCGTQANPCEWSGSNPNEIFIPENFEELYVTITANPGDVIYGASFGGHDSSFRIEVVANNAPTDTQAALDARAAQLKSDDLNKALALHAKYSAKRTSHMTPNGKVYDVWAGVENGPVALLGMYPRKISIKRGQTVQWHFDYEGMEVHNVVFPFNKGMEILQNTGVPVCDPDGDDGTAPDTEPTFPQDGPPTCPEGSVLEFDLHPDELFEAGNHVFTGPSDFENSGVRSGQLLQDGFFSESPWNLKFRATSNDKGWRYLCTIHGPGLMGGRVRVTN